jgi:hypothetical protein
MLVPVEGEHDEAGEWQRVADVIEWTFTLSRQKVAGTGWRPERHRK